MFYCARVNKLQPVYIFDCYVGPKAAAGTLSEDVRVGVVAKVHFHIGCWCRITVDEGRGIAGSAGRSVHIRLIVTWRRNVKRSS